MQVPKEIRGSIAPVFTAFNEDGTLDDAGQRSFLDYLVKEGGVEAYFVRCGMGQMFSFDMDDTKQLTKNVCAHMKGKGAVLVGCSGIWDRNYDKRPDGATYLQQAIELSQYAESQGADGAVHSIPEALLPAAGQAMDDFIVDYFTKICDSVKIPIYIYQTPGTLPEYSVTMNSLSQLADIENMMGIKVSTSDGAFIFDMCEATRGKDFAYIVGAETAFYAGCRVGAKACIGQGASLNPKVLNAIQTRYEAGDIEGMIEAQNDTNRLVYECPNASDFFKRYVAEKGCAIQPHARSTGNPYVTSREPLSQEAYDKFKPIFESLISKYV
jgi:4-hydroxy-tetrahydrodipicolinate synthase